MKPKRLIQAVSILVFVMLAIGLYFLFATPLLLFAAAGAVGHIPTQIFVLIIRLIALGVVSGVLSMGIYFTCRLELLGIFYSLLVGMYFLIFGIGMRMPPPLFILFIFGTFPLGYVFKRFKPTILALQIKCKAAEPGDPANA